METLNLERSQDKDVDNNRYRHYINKRDFELAMLEGISPKALCGVVLRLPLRDPAGKLICPPCRELWELLDD